MDTLKPASESILPCEKLQSLTQNIPNTGRRKSSLRLELLDPDEDEDLLNEGGGGGSRRPSTCSLSRYRSCPQLIPPQEEVSPVCDIPVEGEITVRVPTTNLTSPRTGNRLLLDDCGVRSETPTPPSTPGSKHSHPSLKDSNRESPGSTPVLSRRNKREYPACHRTSSGESLGQEVFVSLQPALRDDALLRLEDFNERNFKCFSKQPAAANDVDRFSDPGDDYSRISNNQHYHHPTEEESNDKCERWLQGLKITRADRLKSRSHIELPPL